ncbi:MAG: hypothetical protein V1757_04490, partial [Actinomycetota bacterium]
ESVLYVQPIYLSARTGASDIAALPEFKRVIVVYGDRIAMRDTMAEALAAVFGASSGDGGDGQLPDDVIAAVAQLLAQADAAFARADTALRAADLATFQAEVAEAQRLIGQAEDLIQQSLAG